MEIQVAQWATIAHLTASMPSKALFFNNLRQVAKNICSRADTSKVRVNGQMWSEFELVGDFTEACPGRLYLMMSRSKIKSLSCPQHFLHYKSMGKYFDAQGHATLKRIQGVPKTTWLIKKVLKKTELLIIHKPNLTSSHLKKNNI